MMPREPRETSHPLRLPDRLADAWRTLGVTGPVVLAVSGGADSLALLRGTCAIAGRQAMRVIVAHLDHALRAESASEAEFVTAVANEQSVEAVVERIDVQSEAERMQRGLEETARRVRYDFLTRVAEQTGARFVATAHTANDLAETVLFHTLRGTGLRGLRGIAARRRLNERIALVRPLLDVTRSDVELYLGQIGQRYLSDPSNNDPAFTRNRLRHELLPQLREAVNPRLDEALLRLARQAAEVSEVMTSLARRALRDTLIEASPDCIRLRSRPLARRPKPIIREAIALAWRRAGWSRQRMGFTHWDAVASIVIDGGRRTLPGGTDARRRQGELILRRGHFKDAP